jgi:hypothetical protein
MTALWMYARGITRIVCARKTWVRVVCLRKNSARVVFKYALLTFTIFYISFSRAGCTLFEVMILAAPQDGYLAKYV